MANVLKIKSRQTGVAGAPNELARAELAYDELGQIIYIGHGNGTDSTRSKKAIGGVGAFIDLASTQTLTNKTYSGNGAGLTALSGDQVTTGTVVAARLPTLDSITTPTASVAFGGNRITGLASPTANTDASTKQYVDDKYSQERYDEDITTSEWVFNSNQHEWAVTHNLGYYPDVTTLALVSGGEYDDYEEFDAYVKHNSVNDLTVICTGTTTGKLLLR